MGSALAQSLCPSASHVWRHASSCCEGQGQGQGEGGGEGEGEGQGAGKGEVRQGEHEAATPAARPWLESPHELEERLQQAADWVNKEFDVRGLCMGLPDRLHSLVNETKGDRLPK